MTWDAVPWFVGGGAQHSPEVARLLAYASTSGAEGIVLPTDLDVTAYEVPGGGVNVAPGACLIRNRAQGGEQQTYVGRNPIQDTVAIAPTSAAARSDLVVAQIEDPFMAGEPWQGPDDPADGPYVFTRVIPNVPPWTRRLQDVEGYEGRSAITLARIDIPAMTATITQDMIHDYREIALPRSHREVQMEQVSIDQDLTQHEFRHYPNTEPFFRVPEWATRAYCQFRISGLAVVTNSLEGWAKIGWGPLGGAPTMYGEPIWYDFDRPDPEWGNVSRNELNVHAILDIPEEDRGQYRILRIYAMKSVGDGLLRTHNGTQATIDIQFYEVPQHTTRTAFN